MDIENWKYNEQDWNPSRSDVYIGSYCLPYQGYIGNGMIMTFGRLYIWQNYVNLADNVKFDRFFFRKNGLTTPNLIVLPTCLGNIECSFCVVDYPFSSSYNINLTCSSNNADISK